MTTETPENRLEALGGMTQEVDGDNPAIEVVQEREREARQAEEVDAAAKGWGMIPFSVGGVLAIIAPELRQVYSEEACYAWGQGAAAVAKKYGWDSPDSLPELALLTSTLGFAVPSYFIVRAKMEEAKEGKASGLLARVGIWWRARQAAKAAKKQAADAAAGGVAVAAAAAAGG